MKPEINKRSIFNILMAIPCVLMLLASCKKEMQHPDNSPGGQIAFINASAQLFGDLSFSGNAYILEDITDTTYKSATGNSPSMPYFSKGNDYMYPTTGYNASLAQPWVTYMNINTGSHLFSLVDTAHYLRVRGKIDLKANAPVSVYYADSMGYFKSFVLQDKLLNQPGNVRLRFLDLSPDAGDVFFTINEKPASASGFIKSFNYGKATPFVSYPNPKTDTLRINFYRATDSTTVIASAFVQAAPGRSYTLALQGYYNLYISYPDPKNTDNYKNLPGGLSVLINTNN